MKQVCVVGTENNGLMTAILAAQEGFNVLFVNFNKNIVQELNNGTLNVHHKEVQEALHFVLLEQNFRVSIEVEPADYFIINYPFYFQEKSLKNYYSQLSQTISTIGNHLKKDDHIIFSSTIPLDALPSLIEIAAHESGLKIHEDFFISYCSEKILPIQLLNPLLIKNKNISEFYNILHMQEEFSPKHEYLFLPASKLSQHILNDDYCEEESTKEEREIV